MGDNKFLDQNQIINGIAILLSFYAGYRYAIKKHESKELEYDTSEEEENVKSEGLRNYKMVLLVRNDLKMGKGKIAAQCCHGAVGAFQKAVKKVPNAVRKWEAHGSAKITLKVESYAELMAMKRAAEAKHINTCLVRDAGHTQVEPNTATVLAIGPDSEEVIDRVTGHLRLL